jgi:hypothetical protein
VRVGRTLPSSRTTSKPCDATEALTTSPSRTSPSYPLTSSRPRATYSFGCTPSRARSPWTPSAGPFLGSPASTTVTRRRARARVSAALNPAAPPPTTTVSLMPVSLMPVSRVVSVLIAISDLLLGGSVPSHALPDDDPLVRLWQPFMPQGRTRASGQG